jgi:hypothetical protein
MSHRHALKMNGPGERPDRSSEPESYLPEEDFLPDFLADVDAPDELLPSL